MRSLTVAVLSFVYLIHMVIGQALPVPAPIHIVFAGDKLEDTDLRVEADSISDIAHHLRQDLKHDIDKINSKHNGRRAHHRIHHDAAFVAKPECEKIKNKQRRERCVDLVNHKAKKAKHHANKKKKLIKREEAKEAEHEHDLRVERIKESRPILKNLTRELDEIFGPHLNAHADGRIGHDKIWEAIKNTSLIQDRYVDLCLAAVKGGKLHQCKGKVLKMTQTLLHELYERVKNHDLHRERPKNLFKPWKNEFKAEQQIAQQRFEDDHEAYHNDDDDDEDQWRHNSALHHRLQSSTGPHLRHEAEDDDDDDSDTDADSSNHHDHHSDDRSLRDHDDRSHSHMDRVQRNSEWNWIRRHQDARFNSYYKDSSWRSSHGKDWRKLIDPITGRVLHVAKTSSSSRHGDPLATTSTRTSSSSPDLYPSDSLAPVHHVPAEVIAVEKQQEANRRARQRLHNNK